MRVIMSRVILRVLMSGPVRLGRTRAREATVARRRTGVRREICIQKLKASGAQFMAPVITRLRIKAYL